MELHKRIESCLTGEEKGAEYNLSSGLYLAIIRVTQTTETQRNLEDENAVNDL